MAQKLLLNVVTAWIGNIARVAAKHYLQVTDADFVRAAQGENLESPADIKESGSA